VLLEIRLQARRHLGRGRGRVDRWLEEYYFLLAAYGVAASRFPNLHQNEWLGVVASAGTAARRLSHPWRELPEQVAQARREARAALDSRPRASCPELVAWAAESVKGLGFGHLPGLACARTWITQAALPAQRAFVEAAAERLAALRKDYPYALEILEVQLLADLDLGRGQKAEEDLARLRRQHVELSHEVESRLGRLYKQRGEGAWDPAQAAPPEAALGAFRQALAIYRGAWVNSGHYYPGVNAAALECLLGEASARRTAEAVLAKAQPQAAVDLWAQFTVGDCQVLLGQADEAARTYRGARERGASPRDLVSVVRQLLLLRRADATVGRAWPDRHLLEVFGEAAVREAQPPTPRAAEDRGALA
jgi:tetratricopeptide (TPR) repeat protein